jgi:hypothetical protein
MSHTPAPWKAGDGYARHKYHIYGKRTMVASVENNEDIALIAAAPDLLAALEYLLPIAAKNVETSFGKDAIRIARAAIAKAKGEQA